MADLEAIGAKLKDMEAIDGVGEAVLVSRGGKFIAGSVPTSADKDTYAAMVATMVGSADALVHEVRETLESVVLTMEKSKILILQDGPKALYALRIWREADEVDIASKVREISVEIEALL